MLVPELVHTVEDYYDGPRTGIADFRGHPHCYRSLYLDSPEWNAAEDRFELSPVTAKVRDLAVEQFHLWQRWQAASLEHRIDLIGEGPRVLPEDLGRYRELEAALAPHRRAAPELLLLARGIFSNSGDGTVPLAGLRVQWTLIEGSVRDGD